MPSTIDSQLMSIGELITGDASSYCVPSFQRDYSWTDIEVGQFWDDIINTIDSGRSEYFLGAIVINKSNKPESLIDGQQRLATISVLMCVLRDIAKQGEDTQLSDEISKRYLGLLDLRTRKVQPKLTLNEVNNNFYQENLVSSKSIEDLNQLKNKTSIDKSNKLLLNAYLLLHQKIEERIEKIGNLQEALYQIEECIGAKLITIRISVSDEGNAYLIFETLNDRGLDLSVADLLKNYIFSKSSGNLQEIQTKWQQISVLVGRFEIAKFMRYYWLSHYGKVREKELYKTITNRFKNPQDIVHFVRQLRMSSEIYAAFDDPQNSLWNPYGSDVKNNLQLLKLFDITNCYSLLLAAYEKLTPNLFKKFLKKLVILLFRYTVICGNRPSKLDEVYSDTAKYIRNNNPQSTIPIFKKHLYKFYINDQDFKYYFTQKSFNKRKARLARYILREINNYYIDNRELVTNANEAQINLEHILPQKPRDEWKKAFLQNFSNPENIEIETYIDRLGNMTLLDIATNDDHSQELFKEKCTKCFETSQLEINKRILEYSDWNPENIAQRQTEMANIACKVWRIDI
ncbi:MAG: DUF262 domain-containing HNH endonuclease family protein [Crocosphaera sp.]|nr:DUF262 domain-containing HNH endonuclease family protein [Crocosphaera sp.]